MRRRANDEFQHTAARRRLLRKNLLIPLNVCGFNTQPRGGGCSRAISSETSARTVSTHSRAEAAAFEILLIGLSSNCFNTQPRGGGCGCQHRPLFRRCCFNTQPRGGGCNTSGNFLFPFGCFNTQPRGGGCGSSPYCHHNT